jgi:hypothetical protein
MSRKIIDLASRRNLWISEDTKPRTAPPQPARPIQQREEPATPDDSVPGWARDIPGNEGQPTMRKPDKCSVCATPIWRWRLTEWVCVNCLIYQVKYDKEAGLEVSLKACKASGVYRTDYLWYEGNEQ